MNGVQRTDFCRGLFKIFFVLMLASELIAALMKFIVNNWSFSAKFRAA